MEASAYLFIKQSIFHRSENERIYAYGELSEIARALVRVEEGIYSVGVVGCSLDDFSVLYLEFDVLKSETLLFGESVVTDGSVHRVFDRSRINLSVRDVAQAVAFDGRYILY